MRLDLDIFSAIQSCFMVFNDSCDSKIYSNDCDCLFMSIFVCMWVEYVFFVSMDRSLKSLYLIFRHLDGGCC